MKPEALYIGRFQPFHKGHAHCIESILSKERNLYIMVGSSNKSRTEENPFTVDERIQMLNSFLEDRGFSSRCIVRPVPDFETSDDTWFLTVMETFPDVRRLYSNNERTRRIFRSKGLDVVGIPMLNRDTFSGTYIRSRNKDEVRELIPEHSKKIMDRLD